MGDSHGSARKGRRWTTEEFFATGVTEIAALMAEARGFGLPASRRRALDFGCGLGRLTQALADHCDRRSASTSRRR
jgi:cyclopropane fatty-acyl-phospholipid synthase-like methyltransferase